MVVVVDGGGSSDVVRHQWHVNVGREGGSRKEGRDRRKEGRKEGRKQETEGRKEETGERKEVHFLCWMQRGQEGKAAIHDEGTEHK